MPYRAFRWSRASAVVLSAAFALGAPACGSDGTLEPAAPAHDADPSDSARGERIEITPAESSVVERRTVQLVAKVFDGSGDEVAEPTIAWASSDEELATVDGSGLVMTRRPGKVTVTATAGGTSAEALVTITSATVASVEVTIPAAEVSVDDTVALVATVKDSEGFELLGRDVEWASEDEEIASVDSGGSVTGVAPGEAKITATVGGVARSVDVRVVHRFVEVFAGNFHSCGLTKLGRPWCWGWNVNGQLGSGDTEDARSPARVRLDPAVSFTTLALGLHHSCGLAKDESVWCWGTNGALQLGRTDGTSRSLVPVKLPDRTYKKLSSGPGTICGLDAAGRAHCWGYSSSSQPVLGDPEHASASSATPVAIPAPVGQASPVAFTKIRHGRHNACGLTAEGRLYCWGENEGGQAGHGSAGPVFAPVAYAIPNNKKVKSFDVGMYVSCAVTDDDTTYCSGANVWDLIRPGGGTPIYNPIVRYSPSFFAASALAVGWEHVCALDASGLAWCWGRNQHRQLGRSTGAAEHGALNQVASGRSFTTLVSGYDHVCGLATDEKVHCWGRNDSGQGGTGSEAPFVAVPSPVAGQ